MNENWQIIKENESYVGDLHDINGRRIIVIVYNKSAYLAWCTVENYYVNIEDFEHIFNDLSFQLIAQITSEGVAFREDIQEMMDPYELEQIAKKLEQTM